MRSMRFVVPSAVIAAISATAIPANAAGEPPSMDRAFQRIGTFPVYSNNADAADATVAEIVAVSENGETLIYTDGVGEAVGFVDITDPADPVGLGTLDVGGESTSVAVAGDYALVAVDTSDSFTDPSGKLVVVDLASQTVVTEIPLGGQPDSVKVSPDENYAAVVIENQRDEDVTVDGVEGGLPQGPAGLLQVVTLSGAPRRWTVQDVDLTGLAAYAADDPEPEFVDVRRDNLAVVTLQENNHIALVDLESAAVVRDFDAGTVDLHGVDATEDGVISLTDSLDDVVREPDGVAWLDGNRFVTANEGDLFGGSRGFTIFDVRGRVIYDSGSSFEELAVRHGHYPESRSENKGTEPESVVAGRFGPEELLFVGSERGSFVAVYRIIGESTPRFLQFLPTGLAPEGLLLIPDRHLFVASTEEDDPTYGVRATISIYARRDRAPGYPSIVSADNRAGRPIAWSALSGLGADIEDAATVYGVWDSYYAESRIFTIDVSDRPAVIRSAVTITGADDLDLEGIVQIPDGTFWVASEGDASDSTPNRILHVDTDGTVLEEVGLPDEIVSCRAASSATATLGSGFEGIAYDDGLLYVAQQRGWDYTTDECEDLDDDGDGVDANGQPLDSRIWVYDPDAAEWTDVISYPLETVPDNASWVGLSEIVALGDGTFGLIERDNLTGDWAELKTLVAFDPDTGDKLAVHDLLPDLLANDGWISDKPEGFTVTVDGRAFVVTDNDGVEDWSGETWFLPLGDIGALLP
jgi:hypothetical protein